MVGEREVLSLEDDSSQDWLEAALRAKIKAWGWLTVKQTRGEIREAPSSKPEEQKRLNNILVEKKVVYQNVWHALCLLHSENIYLRIFGEHP